MAEKKPDKKPRIIKKTETVRERAAKSEQPRKPRRLKQAGTSALRPLKAIARTGRKEIYLPMPDTKAGRFLNKRRSPIPRYFKLAWAEVRQVEWPTRRETVKLTFSVFLFAIFFALIISLADFVLDKAFETFILK